MVMLELSVRLLATVSTGSSCWLFSEDSVESMFNFQFSKSASDMVEKELCLE